MKHKNTNLYLCAAWLSAILSVLGQ